MFELSKHHRRRPLQLVELVLIVAPAIAVIIVALM
jgi:hypothetical protein